MKQAGNKVAGGAAASSFRSLSDSITALFDTQCKSDLETKFGGSVALLEKLASAYILNAFFVDMGWTPVVGQRFTLASFMREHKLSRDHEGLIESFLRRLETQHGILARAGEAQVAKTAATVGDLFKTSTLGTAAPGTIVIEWKVVATPPTRAAIRSELKRVYTELTVQHPEARAETLFLSHIGQQLYSCLKGSTSGIGLLFPPSDSPAAKYGAAAFYENSGLMRHTKVSYIEAAMVQLAQGQDTLRILEIGAGSGGTTKPVLEALINNSATTKICYTFTDISSFFVTKAKPRFEKLFPSVEFEFKQLDIEADPVGQGFSAGAYDIILVADVFHATQYLDDTVAHTRRLLKPGGVLVLGELFENLGLLDLTFGLTDGWWRFADSLREGSPLMGTATWIKFLETNGFASAFAVEGHGLGVIFALADAGVNSS